jgi:hypothetical protein
LQKANVFKNLFIFTALYLLLGNRTTELNLDLDSNPDLELDQELITDPDPNLQIVSDPVGFECTTLITNNLVSSDG